MTDQTMNEPPTPVELREAVTEAAQMVRAMLPHDRALQRLADTCYKHLGTESHEEVAAWIEDARTQITQLKNELHWADREYPAL